MPEPSSRTPSGIVWVIAAGVLGWLASGVQKPGGPEQSHPQPTQSERMGATAEEKESEATTTLKPLCDFFAAGKDEGKSGKSDCCRPPRGWTLQHLIVTVPDPVDSRFGYAFDHTLDAVQRAFEMQHFVLDRKWLPWLEDGKRSPSRRNAVVRVIPQIEVQYGLTPTKELRKQWPGAMLFRKAKSTEVEKGPSPAGTASAGEKEGDLFLVLLVGENPTSGIDKPAFVEAVRIIHERCGSTSTAGNIRVVGPYFSGSQTSLRLAMVECRKQEWWKKPDCSKNRHFDIVSGSADSIDAKFLTSQKEGMPDKFSATVIPNQKVVEATIQYFKDRTWPTPVDSDFVILVESNTTFGQALVRAKIWGDEKGKQKASPPRYLHFPMHLSYLKSAYDGSLRQKDAQLGLPPADSLIPPLDDGPQKNADLIPAMDPRTTAATNAKVLEDLLSVINRRNARYVGVVATDPRDQIFLVSALRDHCPGVQPFLIGSELMVALPQFSSHLAGTVVGSTYPLIPKNQEWTDPDRHRPRLQFSSQAAQGYYNAVLAQIGGQEYMLEYCSPRFAHCDTVPRPPIWITMIGQNGTIVPLQVNPLKGKEEYLWGPASDATGGADGGSRPYEFPFRVPEALGLGVIALLFVLVLGYAFINLPAQLFFRYGKPPKESPSFWEAMVYRFVCLFSILVFLLPIIQVCWIGWSTDQSGSYTRAIVWTVLLITSGAACVLIFTSVLSAEATTGWFVVIVGLLLFGTVAMLVGWSVGDYLLGVFWGSLLLVLLVAWMYPVTRKKRIPGEASNKALQGIGVLWVIAPIAAGGSWDLQWGPKVKSATEGGLLFDRYLNLSSGVSPLLPLLFLCLTFFTWAVFELRKLYLTEKFGVDSPYDAKWTNSRGTKPYKRIGELGSELSDQLRNPFQLVKAYPLTFITLLLAVVLGSVWIWSLYLAPAEGFFLRWLLFFGFVFGFFLTAVNCLRFLLLWSRLKDLLHRISLIPMMRAFENLPARAVQLFGGYLFSRRPRLSDLDIPLRETHLLRREVRSLRTSKAASCPLQDADFNRLSRELDAVAIGPPVLNPKEDEGTVAEKRRNKLGRLTRTLLKNLPFAWKHSSVDEAFGSAAPAKPGRRPAPTDSSPPRWVTLAEGVVALQVVLYISQFFVQLRNLAWSMIVCSLLLLFGITSYPFHPDRLILYSVLALIAAVVGAIVYVLVAINRDGLVSRITKTTPNRFTPDQGFVESFCYYVLPTIGIVAIQLSGAFRFLLEPIIRAVK